MHITPLTVKEGAQNESKTFCEEDVRKVQDHQASRQNHGDLREPQAQAAPGLIGANRNYMEVQP